jgi:hypothetical protein
MRFTKETSTWLKPFEHLIEDQCIRVVFHQIAKDTWMYHLRQVVESERRNCVWNELTDIAIFFDMDLVACKVKNVHGIKHLWDDLNFHTTEPYALPKNVNFRKYQQQCIEYYTDDLLYGDNPTTCRPHVERLSKELCMIVCGFLEQQEKMTIPLIVG